MRTSWAALLGEEMFRQDDNTTIIHCTVGSNIMTRPINADAYKLDGEPFFAWSEMRVYFAVNYDGQQSVNSVPRNPSNEKAYYMGDGQ